MSSNDTNVGDRVLKVFISDSRVSTPLSPGLFSSQIFSGVSTI